VDHHSFRTFGHISGRTTRYDYDRDLGLIDTSEAIELTVSNTEEDYDQYNVDCFPISLTRRQRTDNNSTTYDLAGSYSGQHLHVENTYNADPVLADAVGTGSAISHSGRDENFDTAGDPIEERWCKTIETRPQDVYD